MAIKIWYFARIKEALNCAQEQLELSDGEIVTVEDLIELLSQRGEIWKTNLHDEKLLIAVNQTVATMQTTIADQDEIAFFPPVTGG
ncbi:MAG: molybdopterin converting factor subunit 1 [Cellvibrionaceae bacterium]